MGEVWLAEAPGAAGFAKRLVIKTLRPELAADQRLVELLVAEGRLLEALDHPNIAQILDLGVEDGTWFLAIEMVVGHDLRALFRALGRPLDEVSVLAVLAAAAAALHHAATHHGPDGKPLGIVHYDVTPSNLMVRRDGLVKLVDFGVARTAMMARREAGSLRGKLPYMAPEHLDPAKADPRADLFSLGLCAFELLTAERALEVIDAAGLETAWANLPARLVALEHNGVSAPTRDLIGRMVARSPEARPADAAEVAEAVAQILVERGAATPERSLAERLAPAFERLDAEAQGFDATLAGLLDGGSGGAGEATGTVSLPGLALPKASDAPELAAALSPLPAGPAPALGPDTTALRGARTIEVRRRTLFAASIALLLAGTVGWWLGTRGGGPSASAPGADGADGVVAALADAVAAPAPDAGVAVDPDAGAVSIAEITSAPAAATRVALEPDAGAALAEPVAVDAAATAAAADAGAIASADAAGAGEPERPAAPSAGRRGAARVARAEVRFRVVPADAEVYVDGRKVAGGSGSDGVHALGIAAGERTLRVRDPISGREETRKLVLKAGEQRRLPGFRLVRGLP
ncbi:MAG: hypothetical protein RIT45_3913 [Pseudomonadota bacterium]|jgi:tRNA A-37 threonylcarbamoyl transferase component Bud32